MTDPFAEALHSDGPKPDLAEKLKLYGRFIGAWTFDATRILEDGTRLTGRGEVHFGWVLEGRAVQDVWILPARNTGAQTSLGAWTFYGTTLRVYDPGADAWHIFWSDPRNQCYSRQLGRAEDGTIVQVGTDGTGASVRWSFSRITETSFRWLGERSHDGGATWRMEVEFLARRLNEPRLRSKSRKESKVAILRACFRGFAHHFHALSSAAALLYQLQNLGFARREGTSDAEFRQPVQRLRHHPGDHRPAGTGAAVPCRDARHEP